MRAVTSLPTASPATGSPTADATSVLVALVADQLRPDVVAVATRDHVADDDTLAGIAAIARHLRMSPVTTTQLLESGDLPARRIGTRWRASRRVLSDWLGGDR